MPRINSVQHTRTRSSYSPVREFTRILCTAGALGCIYQQKNIQEASLITIPFRTAPNILLGVCAGKSNDSKDLSAILTLFIASVFLKHLVDAFMSEAYTDFSDTCALSIPTTRLINSLQRDLLYEYSTLVFIALSAKLEQPRR